MRPIPTELTHRPFTLAQGEAAGVTRSMLRGRSWRRLFREVYVNVDVPDTPLVRAQAASLVVTRGAFLCGESAAWLLGIDVRRQPGPGTLVVASCTGRRLRPRPGWTVREITVDAPDLMTVGDVRLTSPVRTVFDCARWLSVVEAVVVVDDLARRELISIDDVRAYALRQRGIRYVRRVPAVLALADPRSESPQETRLRVWMVFDGFSPEPQHHVFDGDRLVARIDLALVRWRIAIEYDSEWHRDRMARDDLRRIDLERQGWRVIRVYAADLRTPQARAMLFTRIRQEMRLREV